MTRVFLLHVVGAGLIVMGVWNVCGNLIAGHGHWPNGVAVAAFGVWVWVRGIRVRREFQEARAR